MNSGGSITECISGIRQGDERAAQILWDAIGSGSCGIAAVNFRAMLVAADEEDIVLSADIVSVAGAAGRFPRLNDRHDLWQVIVMLTARKVARHLERERRQKRGAGRVRGESAFFHANGQAYMTDIAQVVGNEPTPEFSAQVAEECGRLLASLPDKTLRAVAVWKLEGHSNAEIAAKIRRTERTVERKLEIIRKHWSGED